MPRRRETKLATEIKVCANCREWEKDPMPYNGIYFGKCKVDGKIKYEFHRCDFCEELLMY